MTRFRSSLIEKNLSQLMKISIVGIIGPHEHVGIIGPHVVCMWQPLASCSEHVGIMASCSVYVGIIGHM